MVTLSNVVNENKFRVKISVDTMHESRKKKNHGNTSAAKMIDRYVQGLHMSMSNC